MDEQRQHKQSRQILKDLSEVFQKDPRHFFGASLVTITDVSVSRDLSLARVYLSVLPIANAEHVFHRLDDLKSEVRRLLGIKIGKRIRKIPQIAFFHDATPENAFKIHQLINSLDIPSKTDED